MFKKQLRAAVLAIAITAVAPSAFAYKIDFLAGGFSLSAKTATGSGSVSGPGAYKFTYSVPVTSRFEFGIGYTLLMSEIVSGDASFGLDLEGSYFFLAPNVDLNIRTDSTSMSVSELWAPFVNAGFHQRQFQSVQTQYNGFSVGMGIERHLMKDFRLKALARYMSMNGANNATASIIDVLTGVSFQF